MRATILLLTFLTSVIPFTDAITAGSPTIVNSAGLSTDSDSNECADDGKPKRGKVLQEPFDEHDLLRAYEEIKAEYYEKAFGGVFGFDDEESAAASKGDKSWKLLTTLDPNKKTKDEEHEDEIIKVSLLEHPSDPLCPYVKMETIMPLSLESCWDFLALDRWDETMPKMDPFYEGLDIYGEYAVPMNTTNDDDTNNPSVKMVLARKRTKRILAFGKREFVFISVEDVPLADGTWVSGTVSVQVPEDNTETTSKDSNKSLPSLKRNKSYTRAFQDSIAFYKPLPPKPGREQGRTRVTIVCRIDLNDSNGSGGCVPMWLYVKTIGMTGARSVLSMRNVLLEEEKLNAATK